MASSAVEVITSPDQYIVLKELAKGDYGSTLYVRIRSNPGFFAIVKTLDLLSTVDHVKTEDASEANTLGLLILREAAFMHQMVHPNILKFFGTFLQRTTICYAMEYCDGGTLKGAIQRQNGQLFEEPQILRWTAQLAIALKYLHDHKTNHRDVKSENIYFTGGKIKLGDFGVRPKALEMSTVKHAMSTEKMTHIPPEVWQENTPYSPKSDVWSLGVVIYEMCSLHLPFEAGSAGSFFTLFSAICTLPIKPLPDNYSQDLRSLVLINLLERDYEKRFEMAQVVENRCLAKFIADGQKG